ncbi:MAG: hypothetical protein QMD46_12180 [Methanomicrobiales archaeon]|nr:hypothetical protein [Methanomicrobiales archaeon]
MHRVDTPRGTRDHSAPSTIEAVRVYTVRTWGSIEVDCIVPTSARSRSSICRRPRHPSRAIAGPAGSREVADRDP